MTKVEKNIFLKSPCPTAQEAWQDVQAPLSRLEAKTHLFLFVICWLFVSFLFFVAYLWFVFSLLFV